MKRLILALVALAALAWPSLAAAQGTTNPQFASITLGPLGGPVCNLLTPDSVAPNGAKVGSPCDLYLQTSGALWLKASGTTTNTGWVQTNSLSGLTAATTSNTIASGNNVGQVWNWAMATDGTTALQLGETSHGSSGTNDNQFLFGLKTLANSTTTPFHIDNRGLQDAMYVNGPTPSTQFMSLSNLMRLTLYSTDSIPFWINQGGHILQVGEAGANIGTGDANDLGFFTNAGGNAMILKQSGMLAIGGDLGSCCTPALAIGLSGAASGANNYWLIGLGYAAVSGTPPAYMGYQEIVDTGSTYGDLVFGTRNATSGNPSERMRIDHTGMVTIPGNLDLNGVSYTMPSTPPTSGQVLAFASGSGPYALGWTSPGGGGGLGSVSSVAFSGPTDLCTLSGSPVTTTGTLTCTLPTQTANKVWAGPSSGSAAAPTFRALVGADLPPRSLGFTVDGAGTTITTGTKGFLYVPFACTITASTLLSTDSAVTSGSIVIDVWKAAYASYPPTVSNTITASALPTLSSATHAQDNTLTGWTTSVSAGDVLGFHVNSVTALTRVTLVLTCQ